MQVAAFATPQDHGWRWRIVNYAGEVIEESHATFASIAMAVAKGTERLIAMNVVDRSTTPRGWRATSHRRTR